MKIGIFQKGLILAALFFTNTAMSSMTQVSSVPGEYVVQLKKNKMTRMSTKQIELTLNSKIKSTIFGQSIVVIQKPVFENPEAVIESLKKNELVEIVEPNYIYTINKISNDPLFEKLWGLSNVGQKDPAGQTGVAGVDINVEKAWDIQTGSADTVVAVIDTGIDFNHPDLKSNMWRNETEANGTAGVDDDNNGVVDDIYGYNAVDNSGNPMDDQGHGSHCAGTIGAKGNDGVGVAGVNWDVQLMAVKFLDKNGSGTLENAIKAIDYATRMGAKIMSNSWGGGGFSQTLYDSIKRTQEAGAVFIAAAGNDGSNNDSRPAYPASYDISNIISVAAINNKGAKAEFSNYGKRSVHIGAPGVNILSTTGGKYSSFSGTSMATPHVAGVVALLWSNETQMNAAEIKNRILTTARRLPSLTGKSRTGGTVDAYSALMNIVPPPDENDPASWASVPMTVQSESPYKPNTAQNFDVKVPGAKQIAIYFEKFNTETTYDFVEIIDSKGNKVQTLSGANDESYSTVINGDSAGLYFKSDNSVEKTGWIVTKVAYR